MKQLLCIIVFTACAHALQSDKKQSWDGNYYHANSSPQYLSAIKLFDTIDLSSIAHVVDIGCGSGDVTASITRMAPQASVVGIDASQSMIEKAQQTYANYSRVSFSIVDAQDESHPFFKDARFDLAFSSAALLWMANKEAVFTNIARMLKPGGKIVVKTTQPLAPNHPLSYTMKLLAQNPKWLPFVAEYQSRPQHFPLSKQEAEKLVRSDTWNDLVLEDSSIVNRFESEADLGKWMKGWMGALPAFRSLNAEQQTELNTEFVRIYAEIPGTRADGKILYTLPGLIIRATKK